MCAWVIALRFRAVVRVACSHSAQAHTHARKMFIVMSVWYGLFCSIPWARARCAINFHSVSLYESHSRHFSPCQGTYDGEVGLERAVLLPFGRSRWCAETYFVALEIVYLWSFPCLNCLCCTRTRTHTHALARTCCNRNNKCSTSEWKMHQIKWHFGGDFGWLSGEHGIDGVRMREAERKRRAKKGNDKERRVSECEWISCIPNALHLQLECSFNPCAVSSLTLAPYLLQRGAHI